jgi:hypothetical protein
MVSSCSISKNTGKKKHMFPDIIFNIILEGRRTSTQNALEEIAPKESQNC